MKDNPQHETLPEWMLIATGRKDLSASGDSEKDIRDATTGNTCRESNISGNTGKLDSHLESWLTEERRVKLELYALQARLLCWSQKLSGTDREEFNKYFKIN